MTATDPTAEMENYNKEDRRNASHQTTHIAYCIKHQDKAHPIALNTTTIKMKTKRIKPNIKKHTNQKRKTSKRTLANFATLKQKHSPQWLHMLQKNLNLDSTSVKHNNHAKPLL